MADRIKSSFGAYTDARDVVAGHDLTGRVAIVTGGATGIGIETARAMAEAGADVVIAVRKPDLAEAAVADIARSAKGNVSWSISPASSRSAPSPSTGASGR